MHLKNSTKRILLYTLLPIVAFMVFFCFSMLFMTSGLYRLSAMSLALDLTPGIVALLYPWIFWRPINRKKILLSILVVCMSYLSMYIAIYSGVELPSYLSGSYGLYNIFIYIYFPFICFELVNYFLKGKSLFKMDADWW